MSEAALSGAPAGEAASGTVPDSAPPAPSASQPGEVERPAGEQGGEEKREEKRRAREHKRLPGVLLRGDEDGLPLRGPDGKFVSRERQEAAFDREFAGEDRSMPGEASNAPEKAAPELPEGVEPEKKPEAAAKFKFAGLDFKDQATAEQQFRTMRGQHKSLEERARKAGEEKEGYARAYQAWKSDAEEKSARIAALEQELGTLRGGSGVAKAAPAAAGTPAAGSGELSVEAILSEIDGDAFEATAVQHGLPQAAKLLAGQILRTVTGKLLPALQAEQQKVLEPFERQQAVRQVTAQTDALFAQVQALRGPDGKQAFPELNNPETCREIGQIWAESGLPPEHALTPSGLMQAVGMYRLVKSYESAPAAPDAAPSTVVPAQRPAPAAAASVADDRGAHQPPNRGRSNLPPAVAGLLRSLKQAPIGDAILGFSRNVPER